MNNVSGCILVHIYLDTNEEVRGISWLTQIVSEKVIELITEMVSIKMSPFDI